MLEDMTVCEEVFHTAGGVAYADLIIEGHRETWPIRSKRFRTWVRRCYYQATGTAAGAAVIGSTLDLLEARAQFDALERAVSMRVAEHAGRLYLDLADEHWRAVGNVTPERRRDRIKVPKTLEQWGIRRLALSRGIEATPQSRSLLVPQPQ